MLIDFRASGISEIHRQLSAGVISILEIAENTITQIKKDEDKFHAWANFSEETLRQQAGHCLSKFSIKKSLRKLEAIPVGVKDIYNTADFPTEMGSPIWKEFTPGNDARIVFKTKEEGGLIAGKTVTAEFGVHALNETLNPHETSLTPGTSSSGSAVAVALGHVPVALASQTAGSIIRPASFCGVYGFKPSFGTLPRTGTLKTTDSLDTLGFIVSRGEDLIRVFDALRVRGRNYPFVYKNLDIGNLHLKNSMHPWRVAFVRTHTWNYAEDYAKNKLESWLSELECENVIVQEVNLNEEFSRCHNIHSVIYNFSLAYYFEQQMANDNMVSSIMQELIAKGRQIQVSEYQNALKYQESLCDQIDQILEPYDIMISLSTAGSAVPRNSEEKIDPSLMWTMTHLPVVGAPTFSCPKGRPFGIQIVSRRFKDYRLLQFVEYLLNKGHIPPGPYPLLSK